MVSVANYCMRMPRLCMSERHRAIALQLRGLTVPEIHQRLVEGGSRISLRSIYYLMEKYRTKGS